METLIMGNYDPKLELRKVHKRVAGGEFGTMAELHEKLVSKGFAYVFQKEQPNGDTGIAKYVDQQGKQAIMRRVEKGQHARWLPPEQRKSGTLVRVRTAAMPDLWQLIMSKKQRK